MKTKVTFLPDGRIKGYVDYAYKKAVEGLLERVGNLKKWKFLLDHDQETVNDAIRAAAAVDKTGDGLREQVVQMVYASATDSSTSSSSSEDDSE